MSCFYFMTDSEVVRNTEYCETSFWVVTRRFSAGLTIVANVAIATPDWKTWQLSTRYRAWLWDFQACQVWQNLCACGSRVTAFHWNHNGAWNLFPQKLLWPKTFIRVFWAAPVPRVYSGVTRGLIQEENLAERAHWSL